jgi:hypothetical protein
MGWGVPFVDNCVWQAEYLYDCWTEPTFLDSSLPQYITNWFYILQVTSYCLPVSLHSQKAPRMDGTNRSDCSILSSDWAHIRKCVASISWTTHHGITCGDCLAVVVTVTPGHPQWSFRVPSAISPITRTPWLSPSKVSHTCEPFSVTACISVLYVLC